MPDFRKNKKFDPRLFRYFILYVELFCCVSKLSTDISEGGIPDNFFQISGRIDGVHLFQLLSFLAAIKSYVADIPKTQNGFVDSGFAYLKEVLTGDELVHLNCREYVLIENERRKPLLMVYQRNGDYSILVEQSFGRFNSFRVHSKLDDSSGLNGMINSEQVESKNTTVVYFSQGKV